MSILSILLLFKFKYHSNIETSEYEMTRLKSYFFLSCEIYICSKKRWISDILVRFVLLIVTDDTINIHLVHFYLVRVNYEDEDEENDDDNEVLCLLLMQKADMYVTAATSLISLSNSQSRTIHAYIDRFISR